MPSIAKAKNEEETGVFTEEEMENLTPSLEAIVEIPDELLESGNSEAINQYFADRGIDSHIYNSEKGDEASVIMQTQGWWGCSLAISQILVMNAIPIAKLVKIKQYVKALGGVKETAKLLVGATTPGEKTAALVAELTGFTNVKKACNL
ncbi:hypothetical protein [Halobacillus sp. A5]|uniref:hypothetical protein n=1 Tax=Halobacillus sp. A5 TaxID=2880263 RepID=UPI0020A62C3A|nr:hypothetical protein [Halobacillus sp. A5]MCP3028713.1 hypothetical protein [Halobacillus sp. A5]